jgi:AraC-like DNA-binding protein
MPLHPHEFTLTAQLIPPRAALASCVRAYLTRNSLGRPLLPPGQRWNRFPATVHCAVIWYVEGAAQIVDACTGRPGRAMPLISFGGPQTRPFSTYNPGPAHAFTVVFFAGAMHALTGIDLSLQVNQIVSLDAVLDEPWLKWARNVMAAPDDAARIARVEEFLEPRWCAARARGAATGGVLGDWANALVAHAAAAGWGSSARNLERRIKTWAGQPLRRLRRLSRVEKSVVDARAAAERGSISWAELAAHGGFADQSHLCREVREVTGHSPTELARKVQTDESYWVYRVWQ